MLCAALLRSVVVLCLPLLLPVANWPFPAVIRGPSPACLSCPRAFFVFTTPAFQLPASFFFAVHHSVRASSSPFLLCLPPCVPGFSRRFTTFVHMFAPFLPPSFFPACPRLVLLPLPLRGVSFHHGSLFAPEFRPSRAVSFTPAPLAFPAHHSVLAALLLLSLHQEFRIFKKN